MNRKKIICILALVIITLVGGYFYAHIEKKHALYNTGYSRGQLPAVLAIDKGKDLEYCFTCEDDKLSGFDILMTTSGNIKGSRLEYSLYNDNNEKLFESSIKLSKIKNGKFTRIKTDTIMDSAGKKFVLRFHNTSGEKGSLMASVQPDFEANGFVPAISYRYKNWSLRTMIIFVFFVGYLAVFIVVLQKLFRK